MKRPFRLEKAGARFDVPTYSCPVCATDAASKLPKGTAWKIVERRREMGPRGREREVRVVVAEGVS